MSEQDKPWCFICGYGVDDCTMCKRDEPGQLGLFDAEVLIEQDLADAEASHQAMRPTSSSVSSRMEKYRPADSPRMAPTLVARQ